MRPFAILSVVLGLAAHGIAEIPLPKECRQVICVSAPAWTSNNATLQRWERTSSNAPWTKIGDAAAVQVGKRGLGWGIGLHGDPTDDGPRKAEGDRKAPAGVFRLTTSFGRGSAGPGKLPWQPVTPTLEAVDDPASRFYNQIVDRQKVGQPDWHSSEKMASIPVYALGVVVAHNPKNQPGSGSCIFIHLWSGSGSGTAGCTALREADLIPLVRWLDPVREPLLIQYPQEVLQREWPGFSRP